MTQKTADLRSSAVISNGHGQKFSRVRELAITSLLTHPTLSDAAEHTGVAESTLRKWLRTNSEFRQCDLERRRELLDATSNALRMHALDAVTVLASLSGDKNVTPAARIAAARCIVDFALRTGESEELNSIAMRLAVLEGRLEEERWRRNV